MTDILSPFDEDHPAGRQARAGWSDCVYASSDAIKLISAGHGPWAFVWPDEGNFRSPIWFFNKAHASVDVPVVIDKQAADMILTTCNAISPRSREIFDRRLSRNRYDFLQLWEIVSKHLTLKGLTRH